MDKNLATYLACFFQAEQAILAEYDYFKRRSEDPFLSGSDRSLAQAALVQIIGRLRALRFQADAVTAKYSGGVAPPSEELVARAVGATKKLAAVLAQTATLGSVLDSVNEFLNVLVKLDSFPGPAPSPTPAGA